MPVTEDIKSLGPIDYDHKHQRPKLLVIFLVVVGALAVILNWVAGMPDFNGYSGSAPPDAGGLLSRKIDSYISASTAVSATTEKKVDAYVSQRVPISNKQKSSVDAYISQ